MLHFRQGRTETALTDMQIALKHGHQKRDSCKSNRRYVKHCVEWKREMSNRAATRLHAARPAHGRVKQTFTEKGGRHAKAAGHSLATLALMSGQEADPNIVFSSDEAASGGPELVIEQSQA